jgi:VIT1/CCC1 family predicted Fe2+/Mn2+ transporter
MLKYTFCLGSAPLDVPAIKGLQPLRALPADLIVCYIVCLASQAIFGAVNSGT